MQLWPACAKAPITILAAANFISAVSSTIQPAFPPSSREIFCILIFFFNPQPTIGLPVKLIIFTLSSETNFSISLPDDVITLTGQKSKPISSDASLTSLPISSPQQSDDEAGFKRTTLPEASAGDNLCAIKLIGKFHGVIAKITPSGNLFIIANLFSAPFSWSIWITSPSIRLASSLPVLKVKIARSTSILASLIGFPVSKVWIWANSSFRWINLSEILSRSSAFWYVGIFLYFGKIPVR